MNLRLATWLLATTALMPSTASAAGIRGKDKQQRRVLQEGQSATYLVQDIQYEHDESGRRLNLFGNRRGPEKLDTVELSNNLIYTVEGFIPPGWQVSGQDVFLPPATIIDDDTATITLPNSNGKGKGIGRYLQGEGDAVPKVESTLTEDQERNLSELNRQLAVVTGQKTVLAVKVVLSDAAYGFEDSYLECKVFGTSNGNRAGCNDDWHLTNAYSDCSFGKLQLGKAADRTGSGNVSDISNGVVTVTLPNNSVGQGDGTVRNEVTKALNSAFGSATSLANHLMYCLPPNTMNGIAYAYINSWNSVYSNQWCNYVSAQLHEIGHNLNLAHSNEGTTTYADQSGMMGYSYGSESTPRMCFNAAKNYQLGWYSDKTKVITPGASTDSCFSGDLYGTAFYGNAAAQTVGIKVNNAASSTDVYIMFNAKTGIQSGTKEGGNTVMVVTAGGEGTGYAESTLHAKLSPSTTGYSLPGFANIVLYVDSRVDNQYATIRIETNGQACGGGPTNPPTAQPTNAPSNAPTQQPTDPPTSSKPTSSPTTAPPTSAPTSQPTDSPTSPKPTSSPTTAPPTSAPTSQPTDSPTSPKPTSSPTTAPPSNAPTSQPTDSPTSPKPTSSPTLAPTTAPPTSAPTINCEALGQKNQCNNAVNCVWSGNPKTGSCGFNGVNPPSPSPPSPSPPSPTPPSCPYCSATGSDCCGTCVSKGNPAGRGCF